MMMRRRLQVANRIRQHTYPRNDVSIYKLDTSKHNAMGLEECLSVMPKSICTGRARGKLRNTIEDTGKGMSLKNKPAVTEASLNDRVYVVYPNESSTIVNVNEKPIRSRSSGKTERLKSSGNDGDQNAKKRVIIPEEVRVSKDTINECVNENVPGNSIIVTTDGISSRDKRVEANPIAPTIRQINTCDTVLSAAAQPERTLALPVSERCTEESKVNNKPALKNVTVSMFYRRHNTTPTNNNRMNSYTPRVRNPNAGIRCKTSMGHYPTEPEQKTARTTKSAGFLRRMQDVDTGEIILTDAGISALAVRLDAYVTENKICKFESDVLSWDPETRQAVVNFKADAYLSSSVFFRACQLLRLRFVTLMLEECSVNLEQTGVFNTPDDDTTLQVTPLWYAAASSNLDLVRLLTSFGASINATASSGCSVVRAACCASSFPVVAFLVAHDANIHAKDTHGVTCLMNAVASPEIIKLLIHRGLELSDVDTQGNTVLHYAAEAGRLDTVRLLVEMGANPKTANKDRCRPVHTAAKYGKRDVVDYFIKVATPGLEELVDIFLVLGSVCIIMDNDYFNWYLYWHKAFELRRLSNQAPRIQFRASVLTDFLEMQEICGDEFSRNFYHHEALCMQALLVYERIRGPSDDNFINLLICSGGISADNKNFQQAINLWKTAYKIQLERRANTYFQSSCTDMLGSNIINCLRLLLKILHCINHEANSCSENNQCSQKPKFISENIIRDLFPVTCQHISQTNEILTNNESESRQFRVSFGVLVKTILAIFYGYLKIFPAAVRTSEIGTYLQKLIRLNPRGVNDEPLLHMCLDGQLLQSYETGCKKSSPKKCHKYTMCEILLLLGADPLATDSEGNTVLHRAVHVYKQGLMLDFNFFRMLLRLGVHADQVNNRLEKALDLLLPGDDLRHVIQQTALKCLAARKIITYNISYMGEVPKSLYSFIELHACRCLDYTNANRRGH